MKGLPSTIGLIDRVDKIFEDDRLTIKVLKNAGAIPFIKSNVPELLSSFQCNNAIFGAAQNPYDRTRTTGGSTGGEAGLISLRCSPAGIGSDTAGSNRNPQSWCGVFGFKPTP